MLTKIISQKKIFIVLFAVLALSYTALGDTCASELTYPLMYGPGDTEFFTMDMKIDASENILQGGLSKLVQTTVGEGFVMLVDKYGKAIFSKTYASGASDGDIVNKVAIRSNTYIAVGTSDNGTNSFFLLAFDSTGSVVKNLVIATDTNKIANTASITQMYLQGTEAHVVFDNSVVNIVDTAGTIDDRYVGITGESGNIIRIVGHENNSMYSIFAVINGLMGVYWYDTVSTAANKNLATDTNSTIDPTPALQSSDVDDNLSPNFAWVAVYPTSGSHYLAFHYEIDGVDTYPTGTSTILANLPYPPISLSIVYVNTTSFYLATMLTNQQGSVNFVIGAVQDNKRVSLALHGKFFMIASVGDVIVTASNKLHGESLQLDSSQSILFKSSLALNIAGYNCYAISTADTTTVAVYFVIEGIEDASEKQYVSGSSTQTSATTVPADTYIPIRAESTKRDAGYVFCKLQLPIFNFVNQTYSASAADDESTVKDMITQCQGAELAFIPTVAAAPVPWAVGGDDTLTIKPSEVTEAQANGIPKTLSVSAYAMNAVPNVGTLTIDITFDE
jgi:hypothetical protein